MTITPVARGTNNLTRYVTSRADRYVLRVYPSDRAINQLNAEHCLVAAVANGLPFLVPTPVPTAAGDTLVAVDGRGTACLFTYIPGERPDPSDEKALRAAGAAYAAVDVELAALPENSAFAALPDWRRGLGAVHPRAGDPVEWTATLPAEVLGADLGAWLPGWLATVDERAQEDRRKLPVQIVHGDPGLSNVLSVRDHITGIIDFEFAGIDVRVADLADALYMLVRDWSDPVEQARAAQLCAGYVAVSPLTVEEISAVPDRMRLRAAGSLMWRMGRFRLGHATAADVAARAAEAYDLELHLAANHKQLVELVMRHGRA